MGAAIHVETAHPSSNSISFSILPYTAPNNDKGLNLLFVTPVDDCTTMTKRDLRSGARKLRAGARSTLFDKIQAIGQKKWKQQERDIEFYKTYFGFKSPFKVLLDGTFLHQSYTQRLGDVQQYLSTFLGAPAKPFVTSCVLAELTIIGEAAEAFFETAMAAKRLDLIKCGHELPLLAVDCLTTLVGSHNEECYFVATQDMALRERLRQVPGGALIYANYAPLNLEYPSITQRMVERQTHIEHAKQSRAKDPLGVAHRPIFKKNAKA